MAAADRRLPRAHEAIVPRAKLTEYVLDPFHPVGRHKARVFAAVLGIRMLDWRHLRDEILEALPTAAVRSGRLTRHGVAYAVVVEVTGPDGRTADVVTTWIVERDAPPRLTSAWVDIR